MVQLRLLRQIIILSMVFNICTPECIMLEDELGTNFRYRYHPYRGRMFITSAVFQCVNTTMTDICEDIAESVYQNLKIYVKNSNIATLEPNSQPCNDTLLELYLDRTNTSQIDPGFFEAVNNLQVLGITNNQLKEIDGIFNSFSNISKLNLSSNFIETLTQNSFSGLLDLKILDLSNNIISIISNEVFNDLKFLEEVILSQNLLKDVGIVFFENRLLKRINLSKNYLTDFNFLQFKDNDNLENLDLSENLLENTTAISLVNVHRSSPEYDYDNFYSPEKKTHINISHNFLKSIDNNFCNSNLQELDLGYNKISEISTHSFQNCTYLKYLDLQHNNLKALPIEIFINVTKLTYLNLSSNNISTIPYGLFNNLNRLRYLDLSENKMTLNFHTLVTLWSLYTLKLQNNRIENFDPNGIKNFKYLSSISLGNNLWNCSTLANTIYLLKINDVTIMKGENTKTSNILGYTCKDELYQK